MSLDKNLFTLFLTPNPSHPTDKAVVDLTDNVGLIHYRKRRILSEQQLYRIEVTDPLSDALLASATAPSATSKHKTLELYNPSNVVELRYTGTLTFRWSFKWETHEFEWKREECFIIRKPDPPVLVAVTKEPPGRIKTASVQILDYNLNRFDIEDRKGLEIVILTALLTFQDASDAYHEPSTTTTATATSSTSALSNTSPAATAPTPPPKPPRKKGVERIAELQLGRGQVNEVTVLEEGATNDYAKHCSRLLQDDAMLFISVCSSDAKQVPKVLLVVEEVKRLRYKAGDPDLHQYVVHESKEGIAPHKGPRIINLDDKTGKGKIKEYAPPKSLTIHLSKIDIPELGPRGTSSGSSKHMTHDPDHGKKVVRKDKGKDRAKQAEERHVRPQQRPPPPPRKCDSPPRPALHKYKHRSQHFSPTSTSSGPSYHHAHTLPAARVSGAQHPSGSLRRQSLSSLNEADYYPYHDRVRSDGMANVTSPTASTLSSVLLGRFLGR